MELSVGWHYGNSTGWREQPSEPWSCQARVALPSVTHVPHPVHSHPGITNWLLHPSKGSAPKGEGELPDQKEPGSHLPLLLGSSSINLTMYPSVKPVWLHLCSPTGTPPVQGSPPHLTS